MKLVALSVVSVLVVACGTQSAPPSSGSSAAAVSTHRSSCEDSAHLEDGACYDADHNLQDASCCKAPPVDCEDSAHLEGTDCYDADHNLQDPSCCKGDNGGGGSNCEVEDGATCVKSKSACLAAGGQPDGNDCNGSPTGLTFCCAMP